MMARKCVKRLGTLAVVLALVYLDALLVMQVADSAVFTSRAEAQAARGSSLFDKDPAAAAACFEKAVRLDGANPEYHLALGDAYSAMHAEAPISPEVRPLFMKSVAAYRRARELAPDSTEASVRYARQLSIATAFDIEVSAQETLAAWEHCLELPPESFEEGLHFTYDRANGLGFAARAAARLGRHDQAQAYMKEAQSLCPSPLRYASILDGIAASEGG